MLQISKFPAKYEPAERQYTLNSGNGVCSLVELVLNPVLPDMHEGLWNDRDQ